MTTTTEPTTTVLSIPDVPPDSDALTHALAYAAAGWYVGPVARGTKNPGSVLGGKWQTRTTRDPGEIASLFAATDHGVFLHAGRSGALIFDVDTPDALPEEWADLLASTPFQATRTDDDRRGHHLFRVQPGQRFGNGLGQLPRGWGEIRGQNGVIVVAPSQHPEPGGSYRWLRSGVLPLLPDSLADRLTPVDADGGDAATDGEVQAFFDSATSADGGAGALRGVLTWADGQAQANASRHDTCVSALAWAMDEAAAGLVPAREAADTLHEWFHRQFPGSDPTARRAPGAGEFASMTAWAVGKAMDKSDEALEVLRARHRESVAAKQADDDAFLAQVAAGSGQSAPAATSHAVSAEQDGDSLKDDDGLFRWGDFWKADFQTGEWIVPDLVAPRRLVAIYSAAKAGKSLFALELAAAVATGSDFMGAPTKRSHVLYVDYEMDPDDLRQRLESLGYDARSLGDDCWLHYAQMPQLPPLDTNDGGASLLALATKVGAELVVVDTTSRTISGDENSSEVWHAWYRHTGMRLKREGIACLRLDHSGKDVDKGQRGSSAKVSDVDLVVRLVSTKKSPQVTLTFEEARQAGYPDEIRLVKSANRPLRHARQDPSLHPDDKDRRLCEKVSAYLNERPDEWLSTADIKGAVKGRDDARGHALKWLAEVGKVQMREVARGGKEYRNAWRFTEADALSPSDAQRMAEIFSGRA